ncbi:hypothetical protein K443DRAFT_593062 [Laccaria amethystina LaAM-08-1]|uniref:Uncharacterized protein n=1 Tax=Laccaria amethystina LaAM-08-1 TaxID=1095629 RepID=A0A0C9XYB5_9AGAR|nr:hypothetical protein K443DRAFT_593062 [Laccaria amethystina LaAM-08-1]
MADVTQIMQYAARDHDPPRCLQGRFVQQRGLSRTGKVDGIRRSKCRETCLTGGRFGAGVQQEGRQKVSVSTWNRPTALTDVTICPHNPFHGVPAVLFPILVGGLHFSSLYASTPEVVSTGYQSLCRSDSVNDTHVTYALNTAVPFLNVGNANSA